MLCKQMRVLQVNAIYGSKSTGTIVKEIQSCCEAHGIECYVAYSIADRPKNKVPRGYRIGNVLTAKWHALMSRVFGKQAYFNRFTTWLLLQWIKKINPDIVHLHNLHSNYIHLNMLLHYLAKHDIATVITLHDCWFFTGGCTHYTSIGCHRWQSGCGHCPIWKTIPSWFADTTASVLKNRKKYLCTIPRLEIVGASEWIANEVKKTVLKSKDICFIHNGFDLSVFKPTLTSLRKQLGLEDKFVILGPASKWLLPINKPTLEYFISHLKNDMVLVLFGSSSPSEGLPKSVIQIGYTNNRQKMAEMYSMADVFVNCSREDTLSSLNLECQACGTPVVTYDATGSKETVDGICGFAVSTGNVESLWKEVVKIKRNGKESFSGQCLKWVSSNFSKEDNYERYIDLYKRM